MPSEESRILTPDSKHRTPHPVFRIPQFHHGGNVYAFARARDVTPEHVLDFSASINPLGWPSGAANAYRQALQRVVHYPEPYAESLSAALAAYHDLDPNSILVGNGSTQFIFLLAHSLAARRVLLIAPLFSEHGTAFRLSEVRINHLLLRPPAFALPLEHLKTSLTSGGGRKIAAC